MTDTTKPSTKPEFLPVDVAPQDKPKTLDKLLGAVKSVLGNPLVQQALTALVLKKLTKRK